MEAIQASLLDPHAASSSSPQSRPSTSSSAPQGTSLPPAPPPEVLPPPSSLSLQSREPEEGDAAKDLSSLHLSRDYRQHTPEAGSQAQDHTPAQDTAQVLAAQDAPAPPLWSGSSPIFLSPSPSRGESQPEHSSPPAACRHIPAESAYCLPAESARFLTPPRSPAPSPPRPSSAAKLPPSPRRAPPISPAHAPSPTRAPLASPVRSAPGTIRASAFEPASSVHGVQDHTSSYASLSSKSASAPLLITPGVPVDVPSPPQHTFDIPSAAGACKGMPPRADAEPRSRRWADACCQPRACPVHDCVLKVA